MKDIQGVVIGIVREIDAAQASVKVDFTWMSPPQRSHWARIATIMSGQKRGVYYMPEQDDEVLVAFEHGKFDHPYIIGFLWNGVDEPPVPGARFVGQITESAGSRRRFGRFNFGGLTLELWQAPDGTLRTALV